MIKEIPTNQIVYIDESGMNDNDFYPYAYSLKGKRYYEAHPGYYTKRISMIGGLWDNQLIAPFMFEGYCNTELFELYIEQILLPKLQKNMVVIIDNASFHKSIKIQSLVESTGARIIYLPPYSPDFNPIEHHWHKIKTAIRKMMRNTEILLENAMENVLNLMSTY